MMTGAAPDQDSAEKSRANPTAGTPMPLLNLLRAVGSQLIVWHHLAFYGPLSDVAYPAAPVLLDVLYEYGRMAVQLFFVIGGFLTARNLTPGKVIDLRAVITIAMHRYRRIGFPYLATLIVAIGANAIAQRWMSHSSISPPPTIDQLLAHIFFLHDILGFPALSAGIWYLAVDFQLVLLTYLVAAAGSQLARTRWACGNASGFAIASAFYWSLAVASLFWFSRDSRLDIWAPYFFGSYFLGMTLQWTLTRALPQWAFWTYLAMVCAAGAVGWRERLFVAAGTASLLWIAAQTQLLARWPQSRLVEYFGRISYSLFLIHFPVCLVTNAWLSRWRISPLVALGGMFLAYVLSVAAATLFYYLVEKPCLGKVKPRLKSGGVA